LSKIACLSLNSQGTNAQFSVSLTIVNLINAGQSNKDEPDSLIILREVCKNSLILS